jgi:hypothetical protein
VCNQNGPNCQTKDDLVWEGSATWACCDGSGKIIGDPHLRTFDGLLYDFQAAGEFVAVHGGTLTLQLRQRPSSQCASTVIAAAVGTGANRIVVSAQRTPPLWINGSPAEIPCSPAACRDSAETLSSIATVTCSGALELVDGYRVELDVNDGIRLYRLRRATGDNVAELTVRAAGYLDVTVSAAFAAGGTSVAGLLGTPDNDSANDLRTRDGLVLPQPITTNVLYREFGASWRVTQEESLFDYAPGEDTTTFTDWSFPAASCQPIQGAKRLAAEKACLAVGISDKEDLKECVFDVGVTDDPRFAESYRGVQWSSGTRLSVLDNIDASPSLDGVTLANGSCSYLAHARSPGIPIVLLAQALLLALVLRTRRSGRGR